MSPGTAARRSHATALHRDLLRELLCAACARGPSTLPSRLLTEQQLLRVLRALHNRAMRHYRAASLLLAAGDVPLIDVSRLLIVLVTRARPFPSLIGPGKTVLLELVLMRRPPTTTRAVLLVGPIT